MSAHDLVASESWWDRALCKGAPDPSLWFPERGVDQSEAKALCAGCPVQAECLAYALEHRIQYGVWGATSERQRRKMRRPSSWTRSCNFCGDVFSQPRGDGRPNEYCSRACRMMSRRKIAASA